MTDGLISTALISDDGVYRYSLGRYWSADPVMAWVMLNPSTADAHKDDQTIRKCVYIAKREGFGAIEVVNLYALRSTDPAALHDHPDPVGPDNREAWDNSLGRAEMVVAAWGNHAAKLWLPKSTMASWARDFGWMSWMCLGMTKEDQPRHPARIANDTPLVPYIP